MTGFLQSMRRFSLPVILVLLLTPLVLVARGVYVDRQEKAFPHLTSDQIHERLQKGMTKEAVTEAVGRPSKLSSDEKSWIYRNSGRTYRKGETCVPQFFSVQFDEAGRVDHTFQGPVP